MTLLLGRGALRHSMAVQNVKYQNPRWSSLWFQRLQLLCDELLSTGGFNINSRRYTKANYSKATNNYALDELEY
jgi:hypothetical protein